MNNNQPNALLAQPPATAPLLNALAIRYGTFAISHFLVERGEPALRLVMGACIIVNCAFNSQHRRFEYLAISPHFDPVPDLRSVPVYEWHVTIEEPLGFVSIRAVRQTSLAASRILRATP